MFKWNAERCGFTTKDSSLSSSAVKMPWSLKDCKFKSGSVLTQSLAYKNNITLLHGKKVKKYK